MLPQIQVALNGWESPITLVKITQSIVNFKKVEVEANLDFRGVVQPLSKQDLMMKPTETRSWKWLMIHTKSSIELNVGDKIKYLDNSFKVMSKNDYGLNGFFEYHIVENYD